MHVRSSFGTIVIDLLSSARLFYRAHRYRWKLEPREIAFVRRFARAGSTAIDVGAHKGGYAYWMRQSVGPSGQVIAFEPQVELARALRRAFPTPGNVRIENQGISDFEGELTLHVPSRHPSPSASFEEHAAPGNRELRNLVVPVTTLDRYLERPHPPVSLIKCDVEGHELRVFKGAQATLDRERPTLLFECEKRHLAQRDMDEVFEFLGARGYRGFFFAPGSLRPIREFDFRRHQHSPEGEAYCNNFAFLPEKRVANGGRAARAVLV
jgi:FkbM family methyltransferase